VAHPIVALQRRSHASQFTQGLTRSERNAFRVILLQRDGLSELREALGIEHMKVAPVAEQRTAHAVAGTTAELFSGLYTDRLEFGKNVEVTQ
jgi:hypothetical protein